MTIAHLSDVHFGRIAHPEIVDALVREINAQDADLVAVSGDLTQRARHWQFEKATDMLHGFDAPTLVVPGNHDVYAWWYPIARWFYPLRRYRHHICSDLTPTFTEGDLAVLGINSATGRTVKGGRIDDDQREAMRDFFGQQPAEAFKVLVVHHHLTKIQALGPHDVARKAQQTLEVASDVGVDLVLCGHLHISHIEPIVIVPEERRVVIASAGTATSSRGRKSNRETNFYNLIRVRPETFAIEERRYDPATKEFQRDEISTFDRQALPAPEAS
ncbi:MAG: hypothetical protein GVY18_17230 [Bacteroidetes bacterium]|jgi:3',5'-cyclic AMP phosphodiesterase CpdA|nr:hypothetical protein [Bacteroidota bacterium]